MLILKVNPAKCKKCWICCEACPTQILVHGENAPKMLAADRCIACGHCVAICPHEALDHEKAPLSNQVPIGNFPVVDAQTAARFLRSRRSIRCYKQEKIDRDTLIELINIARFAPTASNSQGLSFKVIDSPQILQQITSVTIDWMEEQYLAGLSWAEKYGHYVKIYRETGKDVVLRGAPNLLIAAAPKDFANGNNNTRYSLAYVELYATALGLGTCWIGFIERCAGAEYPPLIKLLDIPEKKMVTGAMIVGYPKYSFKRLVDRNPLDLTLELNN